VGSMRSDGTLGKRGKVKEEERMWPQVTSEMVRDFAEYNAKRARTGARSGTGQLADTSSELYAGKLYAPHGNRVLSKVSAESVADRLQEWYTKSGHPFNRNPPEEIVQRYVHQVLCGLSEADRTKSIQKVIDAECDQIGSDVVRAATRAVRARFGTWWPRPGRKRKGRADAASACQPGHSNQQRRQQDVAVDPAAAAAAGADTAGAM